MKKKENKEKELKQSILPMEISDLMKRSYLDYAMSVIISRALPDVRDGLKPVQRRILYAMWEDGLRANSKFKKSASVVGAVLAKYHPHGDMAVYDALVRMAQDFSLRYPLIEGQGNFGSIDGDEAAAYRYTEAKLSKVGEMMLKDIEKDTVDFVPNYDGTTKEPIVLPSPLPQLLINGALGIAVGMATNIPPHNLREVVDALLYLLYHPKAETEDLFKFIKGPDFPTGGEIFNQREIIQAYSQGKGAILVRGKVSIETKNNQRPQIVIKEIPFQVQKSNLLEQIAKIIQEKKIEGIRAIRDESDKEGMRIVLELQKDAKPEIVLNLLYKFSDLEKVFYLNMLALVDGIQPKVLNLKEVLVYFLLHRQNVILRRTKYELKVAEDRKHILEGLVKCLGNIDKVIKIIRNSKDRDDAREKLKKNFKLDDIQANAILDTRLASLARLERKKIEEELKQLQEEIKRLKAILKDPKKVKEIIKEELLELKNKFGDERRTKVHIEKIREIKEEELIIPEETIVTLSSSNYLKRINPKNYRLQKRGGKGILGTKTQEEDFIELLSFANTRDDLLFFTNTGRVFKIAVHEIPEAQKTAKGKSIFNFFPLSLEEKVLALIPLSKKEKSVFLVLSTKNGLVKKTSLKDFENITKKGLIAINLKKGDLLRQVKKSTGEDEIFLFTKKGYVVRFKEKEIREMGRKSSGIRGIKLKPGDEVIGMDIFPSSLKKGFLFLISEEGFGKKTDVKNYRLQRRGVVGSKTMKINEKTGNLISAQIITEKEEELILFTKKGKILKTSLSFVPKLSRMARGVRLIKLEKDDKVIWARAV
jgi:DNA gyrase subunit A